MFLRNNTEAYILDRYLKMILKIFEKKIEEKKIISKHISLKK